MSTRNAFQPTRESFDRLNGMVAPIGSVSEANLRDTLIAGVAGFGNFCQDLPHDVADQLPREVPETWPTFARGDRVHPPFRVVHVNRVD